MAFNAVHNKPDFVALEREILDFWRRSDAFNTLRRLRAGSPRRFSFLDGPITANNPMGVHHAWGRTYKDLYQRYHAMLGKDQRWQNGFDCQGLWVEVNVEKQLGFNNKHDIEAYGLARFTTECKRQVLFYAAKQTEQSIRLGQWMDWNDPDELRRLHGLMGQDPQQSVTVQGVDGPVTGSVEQIVGQLGMPHLGGSYFTFSDENNYQIWAFLKKCFDKGWVYKGRDVMPWCARCGTGISQHEIVTEGYREITHESVFLRYPLTQRSVWPGVAPLSADVKEALLVWTTTPWTLSSNVAAAVGPELDYVRVQAADGWVYYLAEAAVKNSLIGKDHGVIGRIKGSDMLGWEYAGPYDDLPIVQDAFAQAGYTHRVIGWADVGAEEGTGIVHIAPGCGAEDFALAKEYHLPVLGPLDENGIFLDGYGRQTGQLVSQVADGVFASLQEKGMYYRRQRYTHRYPHCWRCGEELVYRLVDEWFISMGAKLDKPREAVTPEEKAAHLRYQIMDGVDHITWYPSFGYDREMDWLRNMDDWMISKKRYYGLALPIYECAACGHFHVVGSREELAERAVEGWAEFDGHTPHRPYIDAVKIACPHCGAPTARIRDVGNPWLDAGIVAVSTMHYSTDRDYWRQWFPADFITESFPGQFRNWFYSLLAQSTVMTGEPPFKNILGFSTLFAEDGREMHKSWGNAIWFDDAAEIMGADTMRWVYTLQKPEQSLLFGYARGDDARRRFLIPLWNVYSFFVTYANLDGWTPAAGNNWRAGEPGHGSGSSLNAVSPIQANAQLDRWVLERLKETTLEVQACLDRFTADRAGQALELYLDDVSNWYVRRSRRRFWKSEADADKQAAYNTLYKVLVGLTRVLAPFVPFVTEAMYQNLVKSGVWGEHSPASVHHCLWPQGDAADLEHGLLDKMRLAITAASLGRAARGSADIKLRQPLAQARINVATAQERVTLLELLDVLQEEINVKEVVIVSEVGELVEYKVLPNNRLLGPKFGKGFPQVRAALAALNPAGVARALQADGGVTLLVDGAPVTLTAEEVLVQTESRGGLAVASDKGVTVAVDTTITPELVQEGYARDLVRALNNARKEAGYQISDRIEVQVEVEDSAESPYILAALANFAATIRQETLALSLVPGRDGVDVAVVDIGDTLVTLHLRRV